MHYPTNIEVSDNCYSWEFLQKFDFRSRGSIKITLSMDRDVCQDNVSFSEDEYSLVWISFIAMALSIISAVTFCYYFYGMA